MISQYLGNKLIKVLTGQRRVGKSYILRQIAMQLVHSGVNADNILFINRELTAFDFIESYKDLERDTLNIPSNSHYIKYSRL